MNHYRDLGQGLIEILDEKLHEPGEYSINWNAESYTSGIYFVSMFVEIDNMVEFLQTSFTLERFLSSVSPVVNF